MAIIVRCSDVETALFYVQQTIQNNWSRAMLLTQIESRLFERQGRAIQNFKSVLPSPQADLARETLKNPYNFDLTSADPEDLKGSLPSIEALEQELEGGEMIVSSGGFEGEKQ